MLARGGQGGLSRRVALLRLRPARDLCVIGRWVSSPMRVLPIAETWNGNRQILADAIVIYYLRPTWRRVFPFDRRWRTRRSNLRNGGFTAAVLRALSRTPVGKRRCDHTRRNPAVARLRRHFDESAMRSSGFRQRRLISRSGSRIVTTGTLSMSVRRQNQASSGATTRPDRTSVWNWSTSLRRSVPYTSAKMLWQPRGSEKHARSNLRNVDLPFRSICLSQKYIHAV